MKPTVPLSKKIKEVFKSESGERPLEKKDFETLEMPKSKKAKTKLRKKKKPEQVAATEVGNPSDTEDDTDILS